MSTQRVMVRVKLEPKSADFEKLRQSLGLDPSEVDPDFGLVNIDPERGLYAILVDEPAAARLQGRAAIEGVFSNPRIEPFGPPSEDRHS